MSQSLLRLTAISKAFGAVQALRAVSFDLLEGQVHALVGENGAGKSTLVKVMTGALQPDAGEIEVAGHAHRGLSPAQAHRLGIACIYQQPALFPDLTVAENIALRLEPASAFRRVDLAARRRRAQQLLERIGARISPEAEVNVLSMPEQQLVEIACALGAGARALIMDEPTASLTQKEQHLLFAIVRDLRNSGVGIVYITHRLEEVFTLADKVTVLRDGQTVATGTATDMTEASLIRLMVGREVSQMYPPLETDLGQVVLSLSGLGCSFSGLRDISLEVRRGEVLGLAGLVGAGRTELARVLFGITPADAGQMFIDGRQVAVQSPQQAIACGIGYVPEDRRRHGVILELSVAENITMAIHNRIFPGAWLRFAAERQLGLEYIRRLDIKTSCPEAPVNSLSGGNQQKVSVARWLATQPKVLILDEPTQGADVGAKGEIHRIIRRLAKQGLGVLLISSDLPEVIGMSDRIAVMRHGTVVDTLAAGSNPRDIMAAAFGRKEKAA